MNACPSTDQLARLIETTLPEPERGGVEDHVDGCPACQAELDRLTTAPALAAWSTPTGVAEKFVARLNALAPPEDCGPAVAIGTVVAGRYTLTGVLGEGGMGAVYRADQTHPVRRPVALKLVRPGAGGPDVLARFEVERRVLAQMDHPHVATIFDAGATVDGRPFFVMELVNGTPITGYCDSRRLGVRERLALFAQVCRAIQHAHQKGVIHRDIKPSNVLVAEADGRPVPKVIDFGIAKAAGDRPAAAVTAAGAIIGTPEYMSPEQAGRGGADVDTRADVYALGALLYELLAGSPPLDLRRVGTDDLYEMLRLIREVEPARPSARLRAAPAVTRGGGSGRLAWTVRGELDWIVMKCLEKDRDRRYESAAALAADVERYLADEVVEARPPTVGYRVRKFARRNRVPVAAAAAVFLAVVGGAAAAVIGLVAADRERDAARHAEAAETAQRREADDQRAQAVAGAAAAIRAGAAADNARRAAEAAEADTLVAYRAATDDAIENLIAGRAALGRAEREYLERTLARWEAFSARAGDDERSRALRAEGQFRVALIREKLGQRAEAGTGYTTARDLQQQLVAAFPDNPNYPSDLARTHNNLGILLMSGGDAEGARREFAAARDLRLRPAGDRRDDPEQRQYLAHARHNLGNALADLGRGAEALTEYEAALDLRRRLVAARPKTTAYERDLAQTHLSLCILYKSRRQGPQAQAAGEAALGILSQLVEANPGAPSLLDDLALAHTTLGNLFKAMGKPSRARSEYEAACDRQQQLVDAFPAAPAYQISLGGTCCNLGNLHVAGDDPAGGVACFDRAIAALTAARRADPDNAVARQFLRNCYWGRAGAREALAEYAGAVDDWGRAIDLSPDRDRPALRATRTVARVMAGEVDAAVTEADERVRAGDCSGAELYAFARTYALASARVVGKGEEYAGRAVDLAGQAARAGSPTVTRIGSDPAFAPLRGRSDFKALTASLAKSAANPPR